MSSSPLKLQYSNDFLETKISSLEPNFRLIERKHFWAEDSVHRDIFLTGWIVFVIRNNTQPMGVKTQNGIQWLQGPKAIFLPAYEMIEWHIPAGEIQWEAYRFNKNDKLTYQPPMYFSWPSAAKINSKYDLLKIISEVEDPTFYQKNRKLNSVAEKTLHFLNKNYEENLSFPSIAKELSLSHSTMTHYFKNAFGISPIKYRRLLRLAHSAYLIASKNQTITKACYDSGFSDYSNFEDGFKSRYGVQPRQLSEKHQIRAKQKPSSV